MSEAGDRFGAVLAAGDFNGDGFVELAIGVPSENTSQGVVHVLYGSMGGLDAYGGSMTPDNQIWSQASPNVSTSALAGELFGLALGGI